MTVRLRLKLTQDHQDRLTSLADHYGLKPNDLATLMLAQAIDQWVETGPEQPASDQNGPKVGQSGPEVAQNSPSTIAPPPYGRPPGPKVAQNSPKTGKMGQSGPGTDRALLGSRDRERERERENDQNPLSDPEDVATLTAELTDVLNGLAGTKHNPHDQASQRAVYCRLRGEGCEPATVKDMLTVVESKSKAWRGTKYAAGLNLVTLLGDRFGQYLGTAEVDTSSQEAQAGAFSYLGGDQ